MKIDDAPTLIQQGRSVFDRTAKIWVKGPTGTMNPNYLASTSAPAAAPSTVPPGVHRVHGRVSAVGGSTMDLAADDGRTLVVQMAQISGDVLNSLNAGDTVTITGRLAGNILDAQSVQKDKK